MISQRNSPFQQFTTQKTTYKTLKNGHLHIYQKQNIKDYIISPQSQNFQKWKRQQQLPIITNTQNIQNISPIQAQVDNIQVNTPHFDHFETRSAMSHSNLSRINRDLQQRTHLYSNIGKYDSKYLPHPIGASNRYVDDHNHKYQNQNNIHYINKSNSRQNSSKRNSHSDRYSVRSSSSVNNKSIPVRPVINYQHKLNNYQPNNNTLSNNYSNSGNFPTTSTPNYTHSNQQQYPHYYPQPHIQPPLQTTPIDPNHPLQSLTDTTKQLVKHQLKQTKQQVKDTAKVATAATVGPQNYALLSNVKNAIGAIKDNMLQSVKVIKDAVVSTAKDAKDTVKEEVHQAKEGVNDAAIAVVQEANNNNMNNMGEYRNVYSNNTNYNRDRDSYRDSGYGNNGNNGNKYVSYAYHDDGYGRQGSLHLGDNNSLLSKDSLYSRDTHNNYNNYRQPHYINQCQQYSTHQQVPTFTPVQPSVSALPTTNVNNVNSNNNPVSPIEYSKSVLNMNRQPTLVPLTTLWICTLLTMGMFLVGFQLLK